MDTALRELGSRLPARPGKAGAALPVALAAVAAWALAWLEHGAAEPSAWLGLALLVAIALVLPLLAGVAVAPGRLAAGGLFALLALGALAAGSIAWSPRPAAARDLALLALLYATTLAVPLVSLRTPAARVAGLAAVGALAGAVGVGLLARLAAGAHPATLFAGGLPVWPLHDPAALAAIAIAGFWPAVALAARRRATLGTRGVAVGGAALCAALLVLSGSKTGLLGLGVSVVVVAAALPARLRLLAPALLAALLAGAAAEPLTRPYREVGDGAARTAGLAGVAVLLAGCVVGVAYAAADRRRQLGRGGRRALVALGVAVVVGGATASALVALDRPGAFVADRWQAITAFDGPSLGGAAQLGIRADRLGPWRVALDTVAAHPLGGAGGGGFAPAWLAARSTATPAAHARSLPLETLAELGIPGALLLIGALGLPLAAAARRRRLVTGAAALAGCSAWLVQASVDATWQRPAATLPFLLLLGVGAAGATERRLSSPAVAAGIAAALLAAVCAFGPATVSSLLLTRAANAGSSPKAIADARGDLRWAHRLDPLSAAPLLAQAARARTPAERIDSLERARALDPRSVSVRLRLARAYLTAGRREDVLLELQTARELDPRGESTRAAANLIVQQIPRLPD